MPDPWLFNPRHCPMYNHRMLYSAPMTPAAFSLRQIALTAFGPSLLFGLGEGAILPVIPLTARAMGASVPVTALLVGLIGIGSLLSNIPASLITMRHGERWTIVAGAIWCAIAMALCGWSGHIGVFAIGTLMIGMSQAVFSLARQSYLTEVVPVEFRARAMSTLGGSMRIGMFIGPFVAAAAIHFYGLAGAYGVGMVALLASGALAARMPDLTAHAAGEHRDVTSAKPKTATILSTLRANRHVFVTLGLGMLLVSAVRTTRQTVIPLWADHLALEASVIAVIYGLASGIEMLLFYPAGKVMDQMGRRWVVVPSLVIMGAGLLALPLTHNAQTLLLVAMVIAFGNGIGSGMMMTLGADHSPRYGRAHFLGLWRLMADAGALCGPVLLSLLAATLTLGAGVAVTGLLSFLAAGQLAYWIPRAQAPTGEAERR
jgi:MFS family permease